MRWFHRLFRKEAVEKQLDAELRFHIEQQISESGHRESSADPPIREGLVLGSRRASEARCLDPSGGSRPRCYRSATLNDPSR